ncbi:MAG: alpha/beta fold hydrolase [Alphaproteobacteria bacterium]
MPFFERDDTRIYYEIHGDGPPVLALAPGGMQSSIPIWGGVSYNGVERLASNYQVIVMDQRNAGQSTAPITGGDGWREYTADQIALLDHLGVERFHAAGMCIGGSFIMGLAEAVPERLASAVMLQTIGYDDNRETFFELFDSWSAGVKPAHPSVGEDEWAKFRSTMFGGDFLFNVSEDVVARCQIPLLVLMGEDVYHPEATSRRVAELAPHATLIERWKEGADAMAASAAIDAFLAAHS